MTTSEAYQQSKASVNHLKLNLAVSDGTLKPIHKAICCRI